MKDLLKSFFSRFGIRAFRVRTLPFGADEAIDLCRLLDSVAVRVVFDIGANVGLKSLEYSKVFKSAQVHAFEPFAATFAKLKQNTLREPRIVPVRAAMGSRRGNMTASAVLGDSAWNSLVTDLNPSGVSETVQVETVDSYCLEHGVESIDLLKTDTEGFDVEVLTGANEILSRRGVKVVVTECAFDRQDQRHTNFEKLFELMLRHGYSFVGLSDQIQAVNNGGGLEFANAFFVSPRNS